MVFSLGQSALLALCSLVLWRVFRPFFARNPLVNIRGPAPASWWKGNFHQLFDRNGWDFHKNMLKEYGRVVRLQGLFRKETLYVSDPLALHHIVVKDQYTYEETGAFLNTNMLVFGPSLLSTLGDHHRKQRKMLNPVFSLKHMRGLLPILYPIAHQFRDVLKHQMGVGGPGNESEVNILKWMSRAALEYIGQGGLGHSFHALDDTKTDSYSEAIKLLNPTNFSLLLPRQFLSSLMKIGTPAFRSFIFDLLPFNATKTVARITRIIDETSQKILEEKKNAFVQGDEAIQKQVGMGKDIMSVLLKANMDAKKEDRLPEKELLGQVSTFVVAGHDTTSLAACRVFHLLTLHQDVQTKLRSEVISARAAADGDLDYDTLMNLPYLDAVCRETLRLYAPVSQLARTTRAPVVMPLLWPIIGKDGKEMREIMVPEGTDVMISVFGANRDKAVWGPDAEEWKPERWLEPLPKSVGDAHLPGVYASMMTFLGGGRACIGFKFAEMELKMVLSVLLETFIFKPGPEIYWAMSSLAAPIPVGQDENNLYPSLPVRLELVEKSI